MPDELPGLAPLLIPALALVVAAAVAWDQLCDESILRRRAEMLRNAIGAAPTSHDRAVLESLHRDATAKIVALIAVPTRLRMVAWLMYFGGLSVALLTGLGLGYGLTMWEEGVRADDWLSWGFVILLAFSAVTSGGSMVAGSSEWLKTGLERIRVEQAYLRGTDVDRQLLMTRTLTPSAQILEGARESEHVTGRGMRRVMRIQIFLLSGPPWLLLLMSGASFVHTWNALQLVQALFAVFMLIWVTFRGSVSMAQSGLSLARVSDGWVHPRPISPAEQIRAEIETAQRPGSSSSRRGLRRFFRRRR